MKEVWSNAAGITVDGKNKENAINFLKHIFFYGRAGRAYGIEKSLAFGRRSSYPGT